MGSIAYHTPVPHFSSRSAELHNALVAEARCGKEGGGGCSLCGVLSYSAFFLRMYDTCWIGGCLSNPPPDLSIIPSGEV